MEGEKMPSEPIVQSHNFPVGAYCSIAVVDKDTHAVMEYFGVLPSYFNRFTARVLEESLREDGKIEQRILIEPQAEVEEAVQPVV
jgi:hypothetical protein